MYSCYTHLLEQKNDIHVYIEQKTVKLSYSKRSSSKRFGVGEGGYAYLIEIYKVIDRRQEKSELSTIIIFPLFFFVFF